MRAPQTTAARLLRRFSLFGKNNDTRRLLEEALKQLPRLRGDMELAAKDSGADAQKKGLEAIEQLMGLKAQLETNLKGRPEFESILNQLKEFQLEDFATRLRQEALKRDADFKLKATPEKLIEKSESTKLEAKAKEVLKNKQEAPKTEAGAPQQKKKRKWFRWVVLGGIAGFAYQQMMLADDIIRQQVPLPPSDSEAPERKDKKPKSKDKNNDPKASATATAGSSPSNPPPEAPQQSAPSKRDIAKKELTQKSLELVAKLLPEGGSTKVHLTPESFELARSDGQRSAVVLALPIFLNEEAIKSATDFVKKISERAGLTDVFVKVISQEADFQQVDQLTGSRFLESDNSFKSLGVFNPSLGRYLNYSLQDLKFEGDKILGGLQGPSRISLAAQWDELTRGLTRDQAIIGFCGDASSPQGKLFNEMVLASSSVNHKTVTPVLISPQNDFVQCQPQEAVAVVRTPVLSVGSAEADRLTTAKIPIGAEDSQETLAAKIGQKLDEVTLFRNRWVASPARRFRVDFHIDKNSVNKHGLEELRQLVGAVQKELGESARLFEFNVSGKSDAAPTQSGVTAVDLETLKKQSKLFFENKSRTELDTAVAADPSIMFNFGGEFKYAGGAITKESLVQFCRDLESGFAQRELRSEPAPLTDYYSRKLVGSEFAQRILGSTFNQIVFFYSHHCGGCKKFMPMYEELALENLKSPAAGLTFNRIDNEHNQSPAQEVYISTPKIVIYRKDLKSTPIEYRSDKLNKSLLKGFISSTLDFQLISDSKIIDAVTAAFAEVMGSSLKGLN